jgi:peroxiredoxin
MRVLLALLFCGLIVSPLTAGVDDQRTDPIKVGERAPEFTLSTLDDTPLALSKERARGPVVLIVGRGWVGYQCPFCNRQFGDFVKHAAQFEQHGARVIWVYPGRTDDIRKRAEEFAAGRAFPPEFRFVLDPDFTLTIAYGVRWEAPNETAYPSTFVIDRTGIVRFADVSRTHGGRTTAAAALEALSALGK